MAGRSRRALTWLTACTGHLPTYSLSLRGYSSLHAFRTDWTTQVENEWSCGNNLRFPRRRIVTAKENENLRRWHRFVYLRQIDDQQVARIEMPVPHFLKILKAFRLRRFSSSYAIRTILPMPPFSASCCASRICDSLNLLLIGMENNPCATSRPSSSNLTESG